MPVAVTSIIFFRFLFLLRLPLELCFGQWNMQKGLRKKVSMEETFGKWFLDVAKYILTAMFLTTVLPDSPS